MIWPKPEVITVLDGKISLDNSTSEPIVIRKLEHVCNIHTENTVIPDVTNLPSPILDNQKPKLRNPKTTKHSTEVKLNPDNIMNKVEEESFRQLLDTYDQVFSPKIKVYNGRSGVCKVEVNMGPNPPTQRKGRIPFYGKNDLMELQSKFDDLIEAGVLSRPQDIGVTVEGL